MNRLSAGALMYHDIAPRGLEDTTGFPGGDAARYKLTPEQFDRHLDAIAERLSRAQSRGLSRAESRDAIASPILTFDDGGMSAVERIAAALERHGWQGLFFITTGFLGRPGFLDAARVRELRDRGHAIGSHSHSHPLRMANCSDARLRDEWRRSTSILNDVLGAPVTIASVPGGHYSAAVAQAAADAGIRTLYTSTPTRRVVRLDPIEIRGRYAIQNATPPAIAAGLAAGDFLPRARWSLAWATKRALKNVGGSAYLRLRARLLGASPDVRWGEEVAVLSDERS